MRSTRKSSALALIPKIFIASLILLVGILPPSLHAQGNWPMPGHDAQRTGRANFAGPTTAPSSPSWSFPTAAPIVGDITTSAEGNLYFASDRLYALKPDGTALVPPAPIAAPVTGPAVDDNAGLVYIVVSSADGGFDLLSFTKQLQGGTVLVHVPRPPFGGAVSPLLVGDGNVYFVAGRFPGVVYAAGATPWSYPYCTGEAGASTPFGVSANAPALSADGASLFVICSGSLPEGFFRLNPFTGAKITSTTSQTNSTEPVIDSFQHIRSGWQAFGGGAFCGDFLSWDASLALVTPPASVCDSSRFTTSRAVILPDGFSTARIGFAFPPNNQLDATGANTWTITTDNSTIPNFTSVPAVDAAGNIFIGNSQGIQARSSVDGHTLWSFTTGNAITTQPVIANGGALYAGSSSGVVYAFNTQSKNAAGTVYVSSGAVVDLSTASIAARFPGTTGVLRVSPDGSRIYESSTFGMDVIDSATNKVITTVPVGSQPLWIDISPDGSRIYVSQPNIPSAPGVLQGVYVVDAATNAIIASIGIPGPERVAVAPDNSRVYVGSQGRGIAIIDPATDTVTGSISILGATLTGIAFTPDSARAYVGEFAAPFIYQIDARTNTLIDTVPLTGSPGGGVGGVIASPDGTKIYAGNIRNGQFSQGRNVFVIDTATNIVTTQIPVSFPSEEMALSTDGANVLIGDSDTGTLIAASTTTDSVVESLPVTDPCCHTISGISTKHPSAAPLIPQLTVPRTVDFGTVIIGSSSTSNIPLVNTGRVPVTINAIAVSDPNFVIVPPLMTPITLAPGASTQVPVTFTPAAKGIFNGILSIAVVGLPSPATVNLTGSAILPPFLDVAPPALDFGTVSIAETKQLQLQIRNTGDAPLVGSVSLSPSDAFTISGPADFSVSGGQSTLITVNFAPRARTPFSGTLTVASNAGTAAIPLSGQGERVAVVLVHGFGGDPIGTFGEMGPLLHGTTGLDVYSFDYSADTGLRSSPVLPIERIAANLGAFISNLIATQEIDRVDIVAHSMGGLVTRAYIADMAVRNGTVFPYTNNIRKLVTIGTPNYGISTLIVSRTLAELAANAAQNRQVEEMLFSSNFILELDKNWRELVADAFTPRISQANILSIIGTQTPAGSVSPFGIDDDGLVPGPSATLPCIFLSCEGDAADQNVRYVPYQHADFEFRGVDVLGNNPAEAFVLDSDTQTFQLVRDFVLEDPLEVTFEPPAQFTDNGLLLIRLIDANTQKPIRIFDPITSAYVDDSPVEINANGKEGAITIWPISTGQHQVQIFLNSFVYPDPAPIKIDLRGQRPTEITVSLHRRSFP